MQQRQFASAAASFRAIVAGFSEEKDLQDRARVFLTICERQAGAAAGGPRTFEERVNAATVALNRGAFDEALRLLRGLESEKSDSDHVQYLIAMTFAATGEIDQALSHLRRAIALNPENRFRSMGDADLEPLRQHAGFRAALDAPVPGPAARRTSSRKR